MYLFAFVFVVFFQELCDSYIPLFLAIYVSSITNFLKEVNSSVMQRIKISVYVYATDKLNT